MIGNMIEASVEIEGTRTLFWHAFSLGALSLGRREKGGVAGNDPQEWQKTVLYDQLTRQLYLPDTYLFASIREGSKYTKVGRASYQTRIIATLQVLDERNMVDRYLPEVPSADVNQLVYIDIRPTNNPATRGKNIRYRIVAAPGWHCQFRIAWDRTVISTEIMQSILRDSGSMAGVGNARAIGKGRYLIRSFVAREFVEAAA